MHGLGRLRKNTDKVPTIESEKNGGPVIVGQHWRLQQCFMHVTSSRFAQLPSSELVHRKKEIVKAYHRSGQLNSNDAQYLLQHAKESFSGMDRGTPLKVIPKIPDIDEATQDAYQQLSFSSRRVCSIRSRMRMAFTNAQTSRHPLYLSIEVQPRSYTRPRKCFDPS